MSLWKGFFPQRGLWWAGRFFLALAFFLSISTGAAWGISIWPPGPPPFHYKNTKIIYYQEEWVDRYDGGSADAATDLKVDRHRNVYVTGFSWDEAYDMVTIKYDNNGNRLWVQKYNDGKGTDDVALALGVDFDGNVYVVGWSGNINPPYGWSWYFFEDWPTGRVRRSSGPDDKTSYTIIKYSPTGQRLWVRHYPGSATGINIPTAMKVDRFGNVYVTGYSWGIGTRYDYLTVKYDTNGNLQWAARYDGGVQGDDYAVALEVDSFGNVLVTGQSWGTEEDYLTLKYDSSGHKLWEVRWDGGAGRPSNFRFDIPSALVVDHRLNVYVTGCSYGGNPDTHSDMVTIKYDRWGNQQWLHRYDGPGSYSPNDAPYAMVVDPMLNVYIAGTSEHWFCTIKLDQNGNLAWERFIEHYFGNNDQAIRLTLDRYGDILVTGDYQSEAANQLDYATYKFTPNGDTTLVGIYAGPGNYDDHASALGVDFEGNVFVTGFSSQVLPDSSITFDFATVKYKRVVERVKLPTIP